jgi:dCMP deaminase
MAKPANPRVGDWYDRVVSSLDKCVFCDLKAKYIIAEVAGMVLAVNLFPYVDGHLLIIPRKHCERFGDLTAGDWEAVRQLLAVGMDVLARGFGVQDTNIVYREGGVGSGKSLGHLHVHILPCVPGFLTRSAKGLLYSYQTLSVQPADTAAMLQPLAASGAKATVPSPADQVALMRRACLLCDKSTCGYKIGCVIVQAGQVIAEGWNATLPGEVYCQTGGCVREQQHLHGGKEPDKVCSIHAEAYAVAECARKGIALANADVYVSTFPCVICARLLAKAGIARLYYMADYMGGKVGESLLLNNGITLHQLKESQVWG